MHLEPRTTPETVSTKQKTATRSMLLLISLYSLLISFYCLVVGTRFSPPPSKTEVEAAALDVAKLLTYVGVSSKRFGLVHLVDTVSENGQVIPGLNTLGATLRLDYLIGKKLGLNYLNSLVDKDAEELQHLNKELAHSLYRVIQPNYYMDVRGERLSIYERAFRTVAAGARGRTLVGLKLSLGRLSSFALNSMTPATRVESKSSDLDDGRYYYCHRPVPVTENKTTDFYELAPEATLVDGSLFREGEPSATSSVVLLEATFESLDNSGFRKLISHERSCVVIGEPIHRNYENALLLSFPSGGLNQLSSLKELITSSCWNKSGEWQQAVDGPVPGEGHLAPPLGIENAESPPGEAITLALYHWLISMGPTVDLNLFQKMYVTPFSTTNVTAATKGVKPRKYSNSAIVRDTGAARFALLSQSKPGGLGQQILGGAFTREISYPLSAIPMAVDRSGQCRLPGKPDCDIELIRDFLNDLYKTNVAAIESKAVAQTVLKRVETAKQVCLQTLAALNEERRSLNAPASQSAGKTLVDEKIRQEEANKFRYSNIAELAMRAITNAKRTIEATYEMSGDMARFASMGLDRVKGSRSSGYILSRSLVFVPHTRSLAESELYEKIDRKSSLPDVDWLKEEFEVAETPDETMTINEVPIVRFWQEEPLQLNNGAQYIVLSSGELTGKGSGRACVLERSPYVSGEIGQSQVLFYAPACATTGGAPEVKWSLLIRDLVAFQEPASGRPPVGESTTWWSESRLEGEAPCLCVEIQLRTPVPTIPKIPTGTSVQDPELRESIPLVPPMPAELL